MRRCNDDVPIVEKHFEAFEGSFVNHFDILVPQRDQKVLEACQSIDPTGLIAKRINMPFITSFKDKGFLKIMSLCGSVNKTFSEVLPGIEKYVCKELKEGTEEIIAGIKETRNKNKDINAYYVKYFDGRFKNVPPICGYLLFMLSYVSNCKLKTENPELLFIDGPLVYGLPLLIHETLVCKDKLKERDSTYNKDAYEENVKMWRISYNRVNRGVQRSIDAYKQKIYIRRKKSKLTYLTNGICSSGLLAAYKKTIDCLIESLTKEGKKIPPETHRMVDFFGSKISDIPVDSYKKFRKRVTQNIGDTLERDKSGDSYDKYYDKDKYNVGVLHTKDPFLVYCATYEKADSITQLSNRIALYKKIINNPSEVDYSIPLSVHIDVYNSDSTEDNQIIIRQNNMEQYEYCWDAMCKLKDNFDMTMFRDEYLRIFNENNDLTSTVVPFTDAAISRFYGILRKLGLPFGFCSEKNKYAFKIENIEKLLVKVTRLHDLAYKHIDTLIDICAEMHVHQTVIDDLIIFKKGVGNG